MKRCLRYLAFPLSAALAVWIAVASCGKDSSPTGPKENRNLGTVSGKVTYPGGKDFSGITVTLEKTTGGETAKVVAAKAALSGGPKALKAAFTKTVAMTAVTAADGSYRFENVPPGDYSLTARRTENHLARVEKVVVAAGSPTVVDVVLTATANIVGTVLLEGLNDNSGVLVYLAGTSYLAMTDSKGAYTLSDVPLGAYELVVNANEYDVAKAAVTLSSAGAAVTIPVITLQKTGAILGHVVDAVSSAPLANVIVKALSGQADTTGTDGVFALDRIPAGSALLSLTLPNYDVRWVEVSSIKPGEATSIPYPVKMYGAGKTPADVDSRFTEMHSISGEVVMATGESLSPVKVTILTPDSTSTGISCMTDGRNRYTLPAVPYGSVKLRFDAGKQGEKWNSGAVATYDVFFFDRFDDNITFDALVDQWGWVHFDRNKPPVADAGKNQTFKINVTQTIQLDGSKSADPDGMIQSYQWVQKSGPTVWLSTPSSVKPTFVPDGVGIYVFELTVTDNMGWVSLPAEVTVSVTEWTLEELGITLVSIPAGSFLIGQQGIAEPMHPVILSAFRMGATEITQRQYMLIMGSNPSHFTGDENLPLEEVSWLDAIKFCNRLSELAGLTGCYDTNTGNCRFNTNGFRLPTEAEWEYACRAGTTTNFYTGDTYSMLDAAGWYNMNSYSTTHPVSQKAPNPWGLYDMHGNVWEWCNDWYGAYVTGSFTDPTGAVSGITHVIRGGSWSTDASVCRSANRDSYGPAVRNFDLGFRVVRR